MIHGQKFLNKTKNKSLIKVPNRFFIKLAFNGTNYHGWQSQKNASTVQDTLQEAMTVLLKEKIHLTGAGRTDTGVHAEVFYAHFDTNLDPDFFPENNIVFKLNCMLENDIAIDNIMPVKKRAHARYDAISRTYKYIIERKKNPFMQDMVYLYKGELDINNMIKASEKLYNHIDFTSFSKVNTQINHNKCNIMNVKWEEHDSKLIFTITANRFLRGMVRIIVGTLLEVSKGKHSVDEFEEIIIKRNRSSAGCSVLGNGLYLTDISYPKDIFIN